MDASLGTAMGRLGLDASQYYGEMDQAQRASDQFFQNNVNRGQAMAQDLQQVGIGIAGVGAVVTGAFGLAIRSAVDFEAGINAVQAVVNPEEWERYGSEIERVAMVLGRDYPVSAGETIAIMEELAKQGISLEAITNGAAEGVVLLANATGTDLVTSAEIAATTMNQFGYSGEQMIDVANILTATANESASSVEGVGKALSFVGNQASLLGIPLEDASTAIAIMSSRGIDGARAGTGLRAVLSNIGKDSGTAGEALKEFGLAQGGVNSVVDEATGTLKPLPEVIAQVSKATAHLTGLEKQRALERMFGIAGANAMLILMENEEQALQGVGRSWADYRGAIESGTQATDAASIRMQGVAGAIEYVRGALDVIMNRIGTIFLPVMEKVIRAFGSVLDAVGSLPQPILTVVAVLGSIAGVAATLVGGLMVMSPVLLSTAMAFARLRAAGGIASIFATLRTSVASTVPAMQASAGATAGQATAATTGAAANRGLASAFRGLLMAARPLIGIGILGVGAWAAWSKNFLGIRDAAASLGNGLSRLWTYLKEVATGGNRVGEAFVMLPNWIRPVAKAVEGLLTPFGKLVEMWNWLGDVGGGGGETATVGVAVDTTEVEAAEGQLDRFVKHTVFEDGSTAEVLVEVDEAGVERAWGKVIDRVESADGLTATVTIEGDAGPYDVVVDAVTGQVIPDKTTTLTADMQVTGDDKVIEWVENPDALDGTGFDYMVRIKNPDGSLGEFGQIIESYTDESDPNIVHMKVKTDDGEYWTTYNDVTDTWGAWEPDPVTFTADASGVGDAVDAQESRVVGTLDRIRTSLGAFRNSANEMDMPFLGTMADGLITVVNWVEKAVGYLEDLQGIYEEFSGGTDAGVLENGDLTGGTGFSVTRGLSAVIDKLVQDFPALGAAIETVKVIWNGLTTAIDLMMVVVRPVAGFVGDMLARWSGPLAKVAGLFVGLRVAAFLMSSVFSGFMLILRPFIGIANALLGPFKALLGPLRLLGGPLLKVASVGITLLAKGFVALGAAMMANPIALIVVALIALGAAAVVLYKKWEPFRNVVNAVRDALLDFVVKPVITFLKKIGGWIKDAWQWFRKLVDPVQSAAAAFASMAKSAVVRFFKGLVDMLRSGARGFMDFIRNIDGFRDAFDDVGRVVDGVRTRVLNFLSNMATRFPALSGVITAFRNVVDNAFGIISSVIGTVRDLLTGDFSGAWEGVKDIVGGVIDGIGLGVTALGETIKTAFELIPWGEIGTFIVDSLKGVWNLIKDSAGDLWGWISDTVTSVDWWGVVTALVQAGWDAITGIGGLIADAASGIWNWISGNWPDWAQVVVDLIGAAGDTLATIGSKIAAAAGKVWDWITEQAKNLSISSAVMWLRDKGKDILGGLWSGAMGVWNDTIKPWFTKIGTWIVNAIPALTEVWNAGKKILNQIWGGVQEAWVGLYNWFTSLGDLIVSALSGVWDTIKGIGTSIVDWIKGGIDDAWSGFETYLSNQFDKLSVLWGGRRTKTEEPTAEPTGASVPVGAATVDTSGAAEIAKAMVEAIGKALREANVDAITLGIEDAFYKAGGQVSEAWMADGAKLAGEEFLNAVATYFATGTSGNTVGGAIPKAFIPAAARVAPGQLTGQANLVGDAFLQAVRTYFESGTSGITVGGGIERAMWQAATEGITQADLADDAGVVGEKFLLAMNEYFMTGTNGATVGGGIGGAFTTAGTNMGDRLNAPATTVGAAFLAALATQLPLSPAGPITAALVAMVEGAVPAEGMWGTGPALFGDGLADAVAAYFTGTADGSGLATAMLAWVNVAVAGVETDAVLSATTLGQNMSVGAAQGVLDRITVMTSAVAAWGTQVKNEAPAAAALAKLLGRDLSIAVGVGIGERLANVTSAVKTWTKQIDNQASTMKSTARTLGRDASLNVAQGILDRITNVKNAALTFQKQVKDRSSGMRTEGRAIGREGAQAVADGMNDRMDRVRSRGDQFVEVLFNRAQRMYDNGVYMGEMGGAGVAQGLLNYVPIVRIAADTIIRIVDEAMRKAGEVTSPSGMTAYIGRMLTLGVPTGMLSPDALRRVAAAGGEVIDRVRDALQQGLTATAAVLNPATALGERIGAAIRVGIGDPSDALAQGLGGVVPGTYGMGIAGGVGLDPVMQSQMARLLSTSRVVPAAPVSGGGVSNVSMDVEIVLQGVENPRLVADQLVGILESVSTQQRARLAASF